MECASVEYELVDEQEGVRTPHVHQAHEWADASEETVVDEQRRQGWELPEIGAVAAVGQAGCRGSLRRDTREKARATYDHPSQEGVQEPGVEVEARPRGEKE